MEETKNPVRKHPRLKGYDYASENVYFITICTKNRERCLSNIVGRGLDPADGVKIELTEYGKIACKDLAAIPNHFPEISVEKFVIMPDHIHLLMGVGCNSRTAGLRDLERGATFERERKWGATNTGRVRPVTAQAPRPCRVAGIQPAKRRPRPTVSTVIGQYKSGVSRKCGRSLWQTSYYDHVIRSQQDFEEIWRYIDNNPLQWILEGK